jgi:hypothetical protein
VHADLFSVLYTCNSTPSESLGALILSFSREHKRSGGIGLRAPQKTRSLCAERVKKNKKKGLRESNAKFIHRHSSFGLRARRGVPNKGIIIAFGGAVALNRERKMLSEEKEKNPICVCSQRGRCAPSVFAFV